MKTRFTILAICAVALGVLLFFITGCGREEQESNNLHSFSNNQEFTKEQLILIENLSAFNAELLQSDSAIETRGPGFGKVWKAIVRVCKIASADIVGAAVGAISGLVVGTGASWGNLTVGAATAVVGGITTAVASSVKAYEKDVDRNGSLCSISNLEQIYSDPYYVYRNYGAVTDEEINKEMLNADIHVPFLNEHPEYQRIGALHNIAMNNLKSASVNVDSVVMLGVIGGSTNTIEYKLLHDIDFVRDYREQISYISYYIDQFDVVFDDNGIKPNLNYATLSPAAAEILQMFMTLYTQYPSKLDDIDFIVDYYANQIAVSKALNDSEKDAMFSALSVAAYSPRYWIDELGIELTTAEE